MKLASSFIVLLFFAQSCVSNTSNNEKATSENNAVTKKETIQDLSSYEKAYFASGCFWCVEAIFESVKGVKEVISGYAGGERPNPTYEEVAYGRTKHAEAVEVYYDPEVVSFETLVRVFFGSHDPTTLNRQGPDRGAQYRSIAFYQNEKEEKTIREYIAQLEREKLFSKPIVTQVVPLKAFYKAEDYHQDYERRNPNQPYIKSVSIPRLKRFQKLYPELLKEEAH
ncbi:peptide-methionine (S)-S-oxide reductase MsrA [Sungkyunkwania multivorans]|uniref:Peptide methionine sulfoxide reductase MsrA n=1 Tax=Sungkyunkwania multivorans TaxID=1173618 RepID=A0ABW3CVC2_9FLAO